MLAEFFIFFLFINESITRVISPDQRASVEITTKKTLDDDFLSNWMGQINSVIGNTTILDLSLPGSHDTLTYDLSDRVSDGGLDGETELSAILNMFPNFFLGGWIKEQAQTQALNITSQLDNGLRYIDFRIMYTTGDWYGLHCVQTNQKAIVYLTQIRQWLDAHPTEIIVLWLSKHGDVSAKGNDQYPNVTIPIKQAFWGQIEQLFSGLLFDTTKAQLNTTTINELLQNNFRVIVLAADYEEFTNNSQFAYDDYIIENDLMGALTDEIDGEPQIEEAFQNALAYRATTKSQGRFYLFSLANDPPTISIELSAALRYADIDVPKNRLNCALSFNITGFTDWCPEALLDVSQLGNYYNQLPLHNAFVNKWSFPNAIYLDAFWYDGTIKTGTRKSNASPTDPICDIFVWTDCGSSQPSCPDGYTASGQTEHWNAYDSFGKKSEFCVLPEENHYKCCRNPVDGHDNAQFSYAYILIASNVRNNCVSPTDPCQDLLAQIENKVSLYPFKTWDDISTGRKVDWPKPPTTPK
eukprot:c21905_g1_i1.p1 GENE.c21905_g1_i1~~c21905_g1_i1.p1  ORF type:complete len:525 (-),score=225.27 c21905_g1_i1:36-1610(-)